MAGKYHIVIRGADGRVHRELKTSTLEHAMEVSSEHASKYPMATGYVYYGTEVHPVYKVKGKPKT